jgi:hypothetical protein
MTVIVLYSIIPPQEKGLASENGAAPTGDGIGAFRGAARDEDKMKESTR